MGKTFAPTHDYLAVLARVFGTPRNLLVAGLHIPSYSLYYIGQTPYFWTSSVLSISMLLLFFAEILEDQITILISTLGISMQPMVACAIAISESLWGRS